MDISALCKGGLEKTSVRPQCPPPAPTCAAFSLFLLFYGLPQDWTPSLQDLLHVVFQHGARASLLEKGVPSAVLRSPHQWTAAPPTYVCASDSVDEVKLLQTVAQSTGTTCQLVVALVLIPWSA